MPKDGGVKVVVFRPDVRVGTLRTGGIDEPNSEWTDTARVNIQEQMKRQTSAMGIDLTFLGDLEGTDGELLDQYRSLFVAVANSTALHGVYGNHLPTKQEPKTAADKGKRWRMDWTLGPDAVRLQRITGADYGLFLFTHDAYGSAGRKAAVILAAAIFGVYAPPGVHEGYAGLVDLRSGDLVWFNTNPAIAGDPRELLGAEKRVTQLLAGFPAGTPPVATSPRASR